MLCVHLFKFTWNYFLSSHFSFQPKKKKKKTISTLLLLHPRNQMDPRFNMPRALEWDITSNCTRIYILIGRLDEEKYHKKFWCIMWQPIYLFFFFFLIGNTRTIINEKKKDKYKLLMMMNNKKHFLFIYYFYDAIFFFNGWIHILSDYITYKVTINRFFA